MGHDSQGCITYVHVPASVDPGHTPHTLCMSQQPALNDAVF